MVFLKRIFLIFCIISIFQPSYAEERFVVEDIVFKGLQRVDAGSMYAYLPFEVGDVFDTSMTPQIIKQLFKSKFFDDIVIEREGNTIIIIFDERPTIVDIEFDGIEGIEPEQLEKILEAANIAPGRIYDSSVLERIKSELREQNFARGMYSADIKIKETALKDNRVFLKVFVREGVRAKIKQIKITGNTQYSDKKLIENFETALPIWYMFWSDSGVYSSPMLTGDIEALKSFYQNKGFMDFTIESTQVALSKNKEEVYITININEGEQYVVSKINVAGKLIVPIEEIADQIAITTGEYFSRKKILLTSDRIKQRLSEEGYAFARINPVPEKQEGTNKVEINFYIDPGNRAYVRRINISGNSTTQDEVFRRELRQMESGWYSANAIKISKERIQRLGYIDKVRFEEVPVAGTTNQLDLNIIVEEKQSGSFSVGAGIGGDGVALDVGISQDNFLGFGSKVSFNINTAKESTAYGFSFYNPYHNLDSVSRSFGFNLQETKTDNANTTSSYEADRMQIDYNYGLPMTENNRFNLTLNYLSWDIRATENSPTEITKFIADNGSTFDNFSFNIDYSIDTRNRGSFTTSGFMTVLGTEVMIPGSDLEYYKIHFKTDSYFEINKQKDMVLRLKGTTRYGQGYGGTDGLPFYDKYRAGGKKTVRGYERNSLSPLDSSGKAIGGDFMVAGTAELIFRPPIEVNGLRTAFFVDFGRAFKGYDDFTFGDLKGSAGVQIRWVSPFGGISVSWSVPINDEQSDKVEGFQFNLGTN